jgi:diguanylate cyclase (GGDEF)-like protein
MNVDRSDNSTRILIVDDDVVDREMVIRHLGKSEQEFQITESSSVDEGLALYDKEIFDIILLDYRMPQRDGIEMILELRTHTRNYGTAIVMMSSAEDEKLATDSLEAGAQDFIPKSEITTRRLKNALSHAQTRFRLEKDLRESYVRSKNLAEKDSLTGLANRFVFEESLQVAIANNSRNEFKLGLLLFDIDNFKGVNDIHGHDIGDIVLRNFANRIQSSLRGDELFARLGGDEFSIMITNLKHGYVLGEIATRVMDSLNQPISAGSVEFNLNISMGMALHPDNSKDSKELIKCGDIAMYRAKTQKGSNACFFYKDMQTEFVRRYEIEKSLSSAIDEQRLSLVYQPVVNPQTEKLLGFEALLRLSSNLNDVVGPDEFIPIAEQSGLIIEIGQWVLLNAIKQLNCWQKKSPQKLTMAINISPIQLSSESLLGTLKKHVEEFNVDASDIEIEITETAFLTVNESTLNQIKGIKKLGCGLALDDFGTGYSSISHLLQLPINTVKLDKSIMPESKSSKDSTRLLNAMVTLIKKLDLNIIAEGIEYAFQQDLIKQNGVTMAQGYLFDKPLTIDEAERKYFS